MARSNQPRTRGTLAGSLVCLVVFSAGWATVHSLLASQPVKQRVRERFGPQTDRWYRVGFVGLTGLTLWPILPMLLFLPDRLLYAVRGPWRWLMHAGQLLAALGIGGALAQTGFGRFVGVDQLLGKVPKAGEPQRAEIPETSRFYRYVRHPMFLSSILLIWLTPTMTVNLAAAFVMATLYFFVGTFLEESRSVQTFGEAYPQYQARVPRLIPCPGRVMRSGRTQPPSEPASTGPFARRDRTPDRPRDLSSGACSTCRQGASVCVRSPEIKDWRKAIE